MRLLFPLRCPGCRAYLEGDVSTFCPECMASLPSPKDSSDEFLRRGRAGRYVSLYTAPFYYDGKVRSAITRFKFSNRSSYAPAFGRCMAESWRRAVNGLPDGEKFRPDIITWIPVSEKRKRKRGFDQSELLAKSVGDFLGVPAVQLLEKVGDNPPQSTLDMSARAANVIGMYAVKADAPEILGKTVLLVDDVLTTGATVKEASFVLGSMSPGRICAVFAAKTGKRSQESGENF